MNLFNICNKNNLEIVSFLRGSRKYFNEIFEFTGVKSKNTLVKCLNELVSFRVANCEKSKSNTFYSLNFESGLTISILMFIDKLRVEKLSSVINFVFRDLILGVKPNLLILFGSYAKGNYSKGSDLDLLIVGGVRDKKKLIEEVSLKYGIEVNCVYMDFKEFNVLNESLNHIIKTGYPLVGGEFFYNEFKKI